MGNARYREKRLSYHVQYPTKQFNNVDQQPGLALGLGPGRHSLTAAHGHGGPPQYFTIIAQRPHWAWQCQ
jgi:hypothetical protein